MTNAPKFRSLCLETDAAALSGIAEWEEGPDHIVLRSPSEPDHWFGNCVILRGDRIEPDRQVGIFQAAFPEARHIVLQWDAPGLDPTPHLQGLAAHGLEPEFSETLTRPGPPIDAPLPPGLAVRRIETDADWAQLTALHLGIGIEQGYEHQSHKPYLDRRYRAVRQQMEMGIGARFGVFDADKLVADMGIVFSNGAASFQDVATRADYRRRGICAALLAHVGRWADMHRPGGQQVIVADPKGDAGRIYRRAGFEWTETILAVVRPGY